VADGHADGSIPVRMSARELAASLYQQWLGASILAKVTGQRAPLETAMAMTWRALQRQ
jgi:TetR/AcrR family transcriptional repressor of nem operon